MLLSFSIPEMVPYIAAGIEQVKFPKRQFPRVKRQTIREIGGAGSPYLKLAEDPRAYTLHLWWKSRTPSRRFLGEVACKGCEPVKIVRQGYMPLVLDGANRPMEPACWYEDGFDSPEEMAAHFVPRPSDEFYGVLIKW